MNKTEYDGIISKPPMEEVLYHGAFHKYLNKYMGKNGKWVYVYNQAKGMANKAAGAASGALNKAKAALPGLQKQAMSTAVSTRNKVGSAVSSGSKQASALKKKAQNKISKMLPILSKRLKKAQHQATGVKLLARDKTKKLKKTAKGTFEQTKKTASSTAKKVKDKNLYQRTKRKVGEKTGKYKRDSGHATTTFEGNHSKMMGDSRYTTPYSRDADLGFRGYDHAKMRSHMNNYAQHLAKTRKTRDFVTKRRNSKAAATARKNRKAK